MLLKAFVMVFPIHMSLLYFGMKPLPVEQIGVLAAAFPVLSIGGIRMLKIT